MLPWGYLFIRTVWLLSTLSHTMGGLLNIGNIHLDDLLNRNVAGLGILELIGVDIICSKTYVCQHQFHGIFMVI